MTQEQMASTIPLKMSVQPAVASGSGSGSSSLNMRGKQSSRSSRRRIGSTGPPVILGGGVGAMSKATAAGLGTQNLDPYSTLYNNPNQTRSLSLSPIPTSPPYSQPSMHQIPARSTSPFSTVSLPPTTMASTRSKLGGERTVMSSRSRSPGPNVPPALESRINDSTHSLSTTASMSSRTLKTPHSSKTDHNPIIASASGSLEDSPSAPMSMSNQRMKMTVAHSSPTPTRTPVPPMAQGPLPPIPPAISKAPATKGQTKPLNVTHPKTKPTPLSLGGKQENRLSRDWVQIEPSELDPRSRSSSSLVSEDKPVIPARSAARPTHQHQAKMIPMKSEASPSRPSFERANTAPPLSPSPQDQRGGRKSLDHLRSTSPSPAPRQASHSTPPSSILNITTAVASGSQPRRSPSKFEKPSLRTRRSEDLLRPSLDAAPTKKEIREMQQRTLGVSSSVHLPSTVSSVEVERKPTGMSLKKSSGALKALFNRGASGKGKEKEKEKDKERDNAETTPPLRHRKSGDELRRPSTSAQRTLAPSPAPAPAPAPAPEADYNSPESLGRSLFSTDRQRYPTAPPMNRAHSAGAAPMLNQNQNQNQNQHHSQSAGKTNPPRFRIPSRDLPPPPREPSPASASSQPSQTSMTSQRLQPSQPPHPSPSLPESRPAELPPSSSLPYLNLAANRVSLAPPVDISPPPSEDLSNTTTPISSVSSVTTTRPISPVDFSPIKPSKSLHLLSLPELDLDFNFTFDKFGTTSPATPRRSPRKSPRSPHSPYKASPKGSPARSNTTRSPRALPVVQPKLHRTASERRRSQSFDGPASSAPSLMSDFWKSSSDMVPSTSSDFVSPSVSKFFAASNTSSSAPAFSPPLISHDEQASPLPPLPFAPELSDSHSRSESSHQSSDHVRTPSNASSTNETTSPSPPRTPPAHERSLAGLGFGDLSPEKTVVASTPSPPPQLEPPVQIKRPFTSNEAPSIPLPAVPSSSIAPPAAIEPPKVEIKQELPKARARSMSLMSRSRIIVPDAGMDIKTLAREVERLLYAFRYPGQTTTSADRATMLRNDLLTLMVEVDKRAYDPAEEQAYAILRGACFEWAEALLFELRVEQPANERGACLEGLAAVVESACLAELALTRSAAHQARFTQLMIKCMTFVMSKLGAKGVFHNTLLFSGRFLAFAFFRIPHVGEQLVTVLPPPKGALMRFTRGIMMGSSPCPVKAEYPRHLAPLCFDNSQTYTARLASLSAEFTSEEERDAFLFQPGNWLRRWQSDDSELFPAFYRAYHRQLAIYLGPIVQYYENLNRPVPASVLMRAPGYAHLATIFAKKCHSYILGSVNAVTTSSSTNNFEATETAGFRGSQKPPVLETANRRLVETISTFANLRVMIPDNQAGRVIECDGTQLWTDMIDVWTKNLISKTSLYAPKGVFSLFDLLDGIVDPPYDITNGPQPVYSLLDVPNLIFVIRLVLTEGEHALTLVKVIAFVFTHWEVLTARAEDRKELCLGLLLKKELFERLLLFWSQSVRSYVLRLVVFRLGHLHTNKEDGVGHRVEIESVRLLQKRLDRIKKRHDELEPKPFDAEEDAKTNASVLPLTPVSDNGFNVPRSRSTITMVADSPQTDNGSASAANKAERLLGLGLGIDGADKGEMEIAHNDKSGSGIEKATNWFKKSFGTKKKRKDRSASPSPASMLDTPGSLDGSEGSPPFVSLDYGSGSGSPKMGQNGIKSSPKMSGPSPLLGSPVSADWSGESASPTEPSGMSSTNRKAKPPTIITTSPSHPPGSPTGAAPGNGFAFEFELTTMSPRSDTFDPTPSLPTSPNAKVKRNSQPPSPGQPPSPYMSRSFSKRSSLLPSSTASALDSINEAEERAKAYGRRKAKQIELEEEGYAPKFHAYAIRMLAELEDAQKEYDEWWSEGGVGKMDGAPPRLTVAWPFHEGED